MSKRKKTESKPQDPRDAARQQVEALAREAFAQHQLTIELPLQEAGEPGSGLWYGAWRFATPGTGMYAMRLVHLPGRLLVTGDCGDAMWQRDPNMLLWASRCLDDPYYMAGKLVGSTAWTDDPDVTAHHLRERAEETDLDEEERDALLEAVHDLENGYGSSEYAIGELLNEGYDYTEAPTRNWSGNYLWCREAVRHALAAGRPAGLFAPLLPPE